VNQRALDLAVLLRGVLASLGPCACSVSITVVSSWTLIRASVSNDNALRALAEDLGLDQARTERRGRLWWRQASSQGDGMVVVAAGPYQEVDPPPEGK
jgi:hypothetical protein